MNRGLFLVLGPEPLLALITGLAAFPLAVAQTVVGGIVVAVVVAALTLFKR